MFNTSSFPTQNISSNFSRSDFEKFVDEVFEKSQIQKNNSNLSRFREVWNKNGKTRFIVGAGLLTSSVIAVVSGAVVVAGSILAVRAGIGAIGGYLATDAGFDMIASKIGKNPFSRLLSEIKTAKNRIDLNPLIDEIYEKYKEVDILDKLNTARRRATIFEGVKKVTSLSAATVLAIVGGTSAVEAATSSIDEIISHTQSRTVSIMNNNIIEGPSLKIGDIFDDIHHDHPGQGYVTLEQSVRRIEGISQGISLSESQKLINLNESVSHMVQDPSGKIASAMKELGYLSDGQTIDQASRKLSQDKIASILEKVYDISNTQVPTGESIVKSYIPIHIPSSSNGIMPVNTASSVILPSTSQITSTGATSNSNLGWWSAGMAGIAGALGWTLYRRKKQATADDQTISNGTLEENLEVQNTIPTNIPISDSNSVIVSPSIEPIRGVASTPIPTDTVVSFPSASAPSVQEPEDPVQSQEDISGKDKESVLPPIKESIQGSVLTPVQETIKESEGGNIPDILQLVASKENSENDEKTSIRMMAIEKMVSLFRDIYGFAIDPAYSSYEADEYMGTFGFSLTVPTGATFIGILYIEDGSARMGIICTDDDVEIARKSFDFALAADTSGIPAMELLIDKISCSLSRSIVDARDTFKQWEFRNIAKFEITTNDLARIYGQLEVPEIVQSNRETLGHWFSSPYLIKNGTYRFEGLALPNLDELFSTPVESRLQPGARETYTIPNILKCQGRLFSQYEMVFGDYKKLGVSLFNWHKHPGAPLGPSDDDLNNPLALPVEFKNRENIQVFTYAIVNQIHPNTPINSLQNGTYLRLNGSQFGGPRDYIITFWKILRITLEEKEKRMKAVELLRSAGLSMHGLVGSDRELLHLHRAITIDNVGTFGPDLIAVPVSEVT